MTHRYAPTIDELLGDQLILAVMRADRVDPRALRAQLEGAANRIAGHRERTQHFIAKPPVEKRPSLWDANAHACIGLTPFADPCGSALCC